MLAKSFDQKVDQSAPVWHRTMVLRERSVDRDARRTGGKRFQDGDQLSVLYSIRDHQTWQHNDPQIANCSLA